MPPDAGSTSVLILGTPHLAQSDHDYSEREIGRVTETLSAYDPDMLVVEQLPPKHPRGKGRDYRPALNLDSLSRVWGYSFAEADSIRRAFRRGNGKPSQPCRLAKAYLLGYNLTNAHHHAHSGRDTSSGGCTDLRQIDPLRRYFSAISEGEMDRVDLSCLPVPHVAVLTQT